MTKPFIDTFAELGRRLDGFGTETTSRHIIEEAIAQNGWFTEGDICAAVEAIRCKMLNRAELERWIADYTPTTTPADVALIMAGNIPLVGFFDILCVVASRHRCHLKASSKDAVLTRYIVDLLRDIDPDIPLYDYDPAAHYDMAIATGSDEANAYFREHFATTRSLLRGSRFSVAILDGKESDDELSALMNDITAYSGMGCRSVSVVLAPRNTTPRLPKREAHNPKLRGLIATQRALRTMQRLPYHDHGAFLMIEATEPTHSLATVALCHYSTLDEATKWLADHHDQIQCVVSHIPSIEQRVAFGEAQQPTLWHYADGIDTMQFLLN